MERVKKESLHLGQRVLFGNYKEGAVVDGIMQTAVGLVLDGGGYILADWSDVYGAE